MILEDFKQIKHFIFDIDGVLTDGSLLLLSDGQYLRTMNIKDGYALQLAIKKGYSITIISGATGDVLKSRFAGLGITDVYLGISEKLALLQKISTEKNIDTACCLYMGDDMPDVDVMQTVFLPTCPADACDEVKEISKYISSKNGGKGCVRDVIEKVLKLNNDWE